MEPDLTKCVRFGEPLQSMGVESFRIGGRSGSWQLLFGSLAQLDENNLPL